MEDKDKKVEKKEEVNPQILEMQQTITELTSRLGQATEAMASSDKEIKEMREANVKVADSKLAKEKDLKEKFGVKTTPEAKSPSDINSFTNVELLEVVAEAVEGMVDAVKEESENAVSENFKGLESKFDNLTAHLMQNKAADALQKVRTENKDFDNYQAEIKKVLEAHQSFSYQDAYDWIKMKEAQGEIASKHIDSEKPDKDLSTADKDVVRVKKQPTGRKVSKQRLFRNRINEAIDAVQSRRGGD